ncbi:MAG TPA: ABC transporter substrate-binding protein [Gammaproteobacteria bacterium]
MSPARLGILLALSALVASCGGQGGRDVVRIPTGAGGVGFLPLLTMREHGLIEKHAAAAGLESLEVEWLDLGGPSVMNDALISGSVDFIIAGPPGFITLWDRTRNSLDVRGVAALSALPMYLNSRSPRLQTIDDIADGDKIAVTAIKVSIPAIIMQMYAAERYGADNATHFDPYTVSMTHPDGVIAMLTETSDITAHFTSPPFHQRERQDPGVRTIMNSYGVTGGTTTFTMMSTTSAYREANPDAYAAVLAALEEAMQMIEADRLAAADILVAARGDAGLTREEIAELLADPEIVFTTTPSNVTRYAEFMHSIGSIENLPASWHDLFFAEIHEAPGS